MASTHVSLISAGGTDNRRIASSIYGYCTTAAATAAKTVSLYTGNGTTTDGTWAAADLFHGLTISVRFQYANGVASPTLNVNGTGAKPIYRYGTTAPSTSAATSWQANAVVDFTYDTLLNTSGCWVMHSTWDNNTTYSGLTQELVDTGTQTTNKLITAKIVSDSAQQNTAYGTCSTAASEQIKVVSISKSWKLTVGCIIGVKFTYTNTYSATAAAPCQLNVNQTGAKNIYYSNTATPTGTNTIAFGYANRHSFYMYDGTYWVWLNHGIDNNTTYSNASLGQGYGTCTTAAATVAKVVTLSSYALTTGGIVSVKFTYDVPASATMNINSKGAKAIFYNGSAIIANIIKAGDIATFIYDGTQYHLIAIDTTAHIDTALSTSSTNSVQNKAITQALQESNSYNLIPYPYYQTTKTAGGITWTDNGDGTITANGTATTMCTFLVRDRNNENFKLETGTYSFKAVMGDNGSSNTYYAYVNRTVDGKGVSYGTDYGNGYTFDVTDASATSSIALTIVAGITVENLVFKPMLVKGSVVKDYIPYDQNTNILRKDINELTTQIDNKISKDWLETISLSSSNSQTIYAPSGTLIAIARGSESRSGLYLRDHWNVVVPIIESSNVNVTFTIVDSTYVTIANTASSGAVTITRLNAR